MENASKAVVIAGAIFIAVIIISIAMWFVNAIRENEANSIYQAQAEEIDAFNRYFIYSATGQPDWKYIEGGYEAKITGAEMISLIGKARDYSISYQDQEHVIAVIIRGINFTDNNLTSSLTHFSGSNIISTIPDSDWNNFVEKAKVSSDPLLFDRVITYSCKYSGSTGRINVIQFSR